ncbi:MAG: MFS transporter [Burkholderiales bacterium]|nr:MFS transporter [Burkholderiales bacterium]
MWSTLRHRQFRALWQSGGVYFIGNAMQVMAAAWMMIELTGSDFLAAAVQTAVFLPMFLLSLPAGVLADIADRRRLMLVALLTQAAAGALLAALLFAGWAGPGTLMFFIFVAGCCTALLSPAYNSTLADSVPREQLPPAITLVGLAYNAARAVGPALAGLVFALNGAWNFVLCVASTLLLAHTLRRWPPAPHPPSRLPAERLWGGMLSALRFARHSQAVLAQLVRVAAYSGSGSSLWALLPVIGQRQLGLGAAGVGLLMGCLGAGAVGAGLVLGRLRARLGLEMLLHAGCLVFAAAMLVAAFVPWPVAVYLALVLAGASWMSVMSTLNTATQTSAPPWVRARAVSMHVLCALGAFALGSTVWGAVSNLFGLTVALSLAAVLMAAGTLLARRFPLRMGEASDVTQVVTMWEDFVIADEPSPEAGPVAVEIAYRVRAGDVAAFLEAASHLRAPRRRDGATFWRLYRDLAEPARYVERFIVTSWADYLHQRARATLADQELEARVRSFLRPDQAVTTQHYIAER